jgi:hypothetical protein
LGDEAFFWSVGNGMQNLRELLESAGAAGVTGWTLTKATGISSDGRTIVGYGISPQGHEEAWMATIPLPEPDSLSLLTLALLPIRRWKRRALLPSR